MTNVQSELGSAVSGTGSDSRWLRCLRRVSDPALRIYGFPHSGGNASLFRPWVGELPRGVELWAVQLPGRENRIAEAPITNLRQLADQLADVFGAEQPVPFVFFGHSLGGLLSFEVARRLRRLRRAGPVRLFVSGVRAPHLPDHDPPIRDLPDAEFIAKLGALNGTPANLLGNQELMDLLMPVLRADCELSETYSYEDDEPLDCSIVVFAGDADPRTPVESVGPWRRHTAAAFAVEVFSGDHFYVMTAQKDVTSRLSAHLAPVLRGS
jgi:medium-chain acyl-[acyl-carrier-protein] hydrolase